MLLSADHTAIHHTKFPDTEPGLSVELFENVSRVHFLNTVRVHSHSLSMGNHKQATVNTSLHVSPWLHT